MLDRRMFLKGLLALPSAQLSWGCTSTLPVTSHINDSVCVWIDPFLPNIPIPPWFRGPWIEALGCKADDQGWIANDPRDQISQAIRQTLNLQNEQLRITLPKDTLSVGVYACVITGKTFQVRRPILIGPDH